MTVRFLVPILCVAAMVLGACGGDDKGKGVPSTTASGLLAELGAVQRRLDQGSVGACEDVLDESVPAIQKQIDSLPDDTDADLRTALEESFTKLRTLSEQECDKRRQEAEDKKKDTTAETTPPPTTTEAPPPPTTTETTPPPTTTETTPKPEPEKKDEAKPKPKPKGKDNSGTGGTPGITPEASPGGGTGAGALVPRGDG